MRRSALLRITPYVRRHWGKLAFGIAASFVEILFETRIPLIIKDAINGPLRHASERGRLPGLVLLIFVFGTAEVLLAFARRNAHSRAANTVEMEIRNDLYDHLQRLHVSFHDGWQSGQLLSRAVQDIHSIRRFVGFALPFLVILTFQVGYIFYLLQELNRPLALMAVGGIVPVGYISYRFSKSYRKIARRVKEDEGDLGTIIEEAATGIRILKAFGRGPQIRNKFRAQAGKLRESSMGWVRASALTWPTFDIFPNLTLALILALGGISVIRGTAGFDLGVLVAFVLLVRQLVWPMDALGWILAMREEAATAVDRISEVLDTPPAIADHPGAAAISRASGRITLENAWFRYDEGRDWVLKDVSLSVQPGETMALVGRTGCGKTTLAMLVPRLYDVARGSVRIDGHDVRELTVSSLRAQVGVAFEDPILFSASVRENLLMGRPEAGEAEIEAALQTAQADFVHELPFGLETRVGEQGHTLSGGQRQRLALARAVLGGPRVLVLDDPLSSVDVHTEAVIEDALKNVLADRTALLVVHRPSTLALADRVALLDDGRIVAVGTHKELLGEVALYRAVLSQEAEQLQAGEVSV